MFHPQHIMPNTSSLLLIHVMYIYGAGVALFGVYCLYKGIQELFR